jgi:hypothetical protein
MVQELMADWFLYEQDRRLSAPPAVHKREWEAAQRVERLESELTLERARLGEPTPDIRDVWRDIAA